METSSRKQSFSQALSIAIPEADGVTGTWARVPGALVPFPEPQDVPPYVKAAGNPLRACGLNSIGMDRRGIPAEVRLEVKRAYRILYRSQLNVAQALSRITRDLKPYPEIHEFDEFVRSSERGIVR